jgi:hypothetical protein
MAKPDKDWSLKQVRAREALNALAAKNGAIPGVISMSRISIPASVRILFSAPGSISPPVTISWNPASRRSTP